MQLSPVEDRAALTAMDEPAPRDPLASTSPTVTGPSPRCIAERSGAELDTAGRVTVERGLVAEQRFQFRRVGEWFRLKLNSDDFQNLVVQGLVESVTRFRDSRAASPMSWCSA